MDGSRLAARVIGPRLAWRSLASDTKGSSCDAAGGPRARSAGTATVLNRRIGRQEWGTLTPMHVSHLSWGNNWEGRGRAAAMVLIEEARADKPNAAATVRQHGVSLPPATEVLTR